MSVIPPGRLLFASSLVSVVMLVGLGLSFLATDSKLALAQAADSFADALTGLGLWWALRLSRSPPDAEHPYGHHSAQPIAALVVAMLVGALALEVLLDAIEALRADQPAVLGWSVAAALAGKVVIKAVLVRLASVPEQLRTNAALRAFRVDARSDVLVGLTSLAGFFGARLGDWPMLDAWLAIPIALWIGVSGIELAKESIDLLMGTAPPRAWQDALVEDLLDRPQVRAVAAIKARSFGDGMHVWVEVRVDPYLTVGEGHDIGEAVEAYLRQREDVSDAVVHVDAATGLTPPPSS